MVTLFAFVQVAIGRLLAVVALVVLGPAVLLALVLVRTVSSGPTVLLDEIPTPNGHVHRSYRIRTTGSGHAAFPVVGRLLRKMKIDELPGLWSVAKGDVPLRKWFDWFRE